MTLGACFHKQLLHHSNVHEQVLKCTISELENKNQTITPAFEEFDALNTNKIYYTYEDRETVVNDFFLLQGFNDLKYWKKVTNDIKHQMQNYRVIPLSKTSQSAKQISLDGLTIFISQPLATDSCYYVHADYGSNYVEGIICKLTLDYKLVSYFRYAGIK